MELGIYDSSGTLIESSNSPTALNASITRTLAPGLYYVRINGAARGTGATGFTSYASIGQYSLTGSLPAAVAGPEINVIGSNNATISTAIPYRALSMERTSVRPRSPG